MILDRLLDQAKPDKIGTQRRLASNVDAIESFRSMLDEVDLFGAKPSLAPNSAPKLPIWNVDVSVRPEIILRVQGKSGQSLLGAVKLHFPRTFSLNEEGGGLVSAVMQEWFKTNMPDDGVPSGPHCYVIDIGARRVCKGVRSTTARIKEVTANCRNIAALWPTISLEDD